MMKIESLIIDLCEEIDDLKFALKQSQKELDYYKKEYNSLMSSSIAHSQTMMNHVLVAAMNGAFTKEEK